MNESDRAEMEAARNAAEDEYFNARPKLLRSTAAENIYRAGFENAWKQLWKPTKPFPGGLQVVQLEHFARPVGLVAFSFAPERIAGSLRDLALQVEAGDIIPQQIDLNSSAPLNEFQTTTLVFKYARKMPNG